MSVNNVQLLGNLGRDPEVRALPDGSPVCNFSVATTRKWRDKATGQMKEDTQWHNCVVFGRQAENAAQWLARGSKVYLEGTLKYETWEDKQTGNKRGPRAKVQVLRFENLTPRESQAPYAGPVPVQPPLPYSAPGAPPQVFPPPQQVQAQAGRGDEDIPF